MRHVRHHMLTLSVMGALVGTLALHTGQAMGGSPDTITVPGEVAADAVVQYGGWIGSTRRHTLSDVYPGGGDLWSTSDVDLQLHDLVFRREVRPDDGVAQAFVAVRATRDYRYHSDSGHVRRDVVDCVITGQRTDVIRFDASRPPRNEGVAVDDRKGLLVITEDAAGRLGYFGIVVDPDPMRLRHRCDPARYSRTGRSAPAATLLFTNVGTDPRVQNLRRLTDPLRIEQRVDTIFPREPNGPERTIDNRWDLRPTSAVAADVLAIPAADDPGMVDAFLRIVNRGTTDVSDVRAPETITAEGVGLAHQVEGPTNATLASLGPGETAVFRYRFEVDRDGPLAFLATARAHDDTVDTDFPVHAEGGLSLVVNVDGDAALPVDAAACDVDTGADGLQCTLRAAIELANQLPGRNAIAFDGVNHIRPRSALPEIDSPLAIDGTLPGGGRVELDGRDAGPVNGLVVSGGGATLHGLVIHSFGGSGIVLAGAGGSTVTDSVIGLTPDGRCPAFDAGARVCRGNGGHGIFIDGSDTNTIGGLIDGASCVDPCNVIAGNAMDGVSIQGGGGGTPDAPTPTTGDGNRILGNVIGLDASGVCGDRSPQGGCLTGNGHSGVHIDTASFTQVGGPAAAAWTCSGTCNVIGGNRLHGITLTGLPGSTRETRVQGNRIGTDRDGDCTLVAGGGCREGNLGSGVLVAGGRADTSRANDARIGGLMPGEGNVISGNQVAGVSFVGAAAGDILVAGNRIGTDPDGTTAVPNGAGILLDSAEVSVGEGVVSGPATGYIAIGGPSEVGACTLACNLISGNTGSGITIRDQDHRSGALIAGNLIGTTVTGAAALGNGGHGIEGVRAGFLTIGGVATDGWNVISGNRGSGISVEHGDPGSITRSLIGTDPTGTFAVPNERHGILIVATIMSVGRAGGCDPVCNVVSGNRGHGIAVESVTGTLRDGPELFAMCICGNRVGTDLTGTRPLGNGRVGIVIVSSETIDVGTPRSANTVSANRETGIALDGTAAVSLRNNRIGTAGDGTCTPDGRGRCPLGNANLGVLVRDSVGALVGGPGEGEGNTIAGNASGLLVPGVIVSGRDSQGVRLEGNRIGIARDGAAVPNGGGGIWIRGAVGTIVGGDRPAFGNVISGNGPDCACSGVTIFGGAKDTQVLGNRIGTLPDGETPAPNGGHGINVHASTGTRIGGEAPSTGNVIAHNGGARGFDGIRIARDAGPGTDIRSNRIFDNVGQGIDLGANGLTPETATHGVPVLVDARGRSVTGDVSGPPGADLRVDLYRSPACDGGVFGSGEGREPAASVEVRLGADGTAGFSARVTGRGVITATATVEGDTSEFSRCIERGEVVDGADGDGDGVSDGIEDAIAAGGDGDGDGTPDRLQSDVASLPNAIDGRPVTVSVSEPGRLSAVSAVDMPSPEDAPVGVDFPDGFVALTVSVSPGADVLLGMSAPVEASPMTIWAWHATLGAGSVATPEPGPAGTGVAGEFSAGDPPADLDPGRAGGSRWSELADATIQDGSATLSIRDGSAADPDGAADGVVRLVVGVGQRP